MLVWRLCRRPFADLSGTGGLRAPGRWHSAGKPALYTAYEPALAILEVRVNLDLPFEDLPDDYVLMGIDISALSVENVVQAGELAQTRDVGDSWLAGKRTVALRVPSVLAPRGVNYLLNPLHPQAKGAVIVEVTDFRFDGRLWR